MSTSTWRLTLLSAAIAIVALDAVIATPIGLPLLYAVLIVLAGLRLPKPDTIAFAFLCASARILVGTSADVLGLAHLTWSPPAMVEQASQVVMSLGTFVALGWLVATVRDKDRQLDDLRSQTLLDPLTHLGNRRVLERILAREAGHPFAVIAVDVDRFKSINDGHGHATGDRVLIELAARLQRLIRVGDFVVRTGGEEFFLLLPNADQTVARRVAEGACATVRDAPFDVGAALDVTVSAGAAVGDLDAALLELADGALYRAKNEGRDRYVLAPTPGPLSA